MLDRADYMNEIDFLPATGKIYVDTCGLTFVGRGRDNDVGGLEARAVRVRNFLNVFKERGNIVTTKAVISELAGDVTDFNELRQKAYGLLRVGDEDEKWEARDDIESLDKYVELYRELLKFLKRNVDEEVRCNETSGICDLVENFVSGNGRTLSKCDKGLVVAALSSGVSSGILTADTPMMGAYRAGVKNFGLRDCFISDAIGCRTERIVG